MFGWRKGVKRKLMQNNQLDVQNIYQPAGDRSLVVFSPRDRRQTVMQSHPLQTFISNWKKYRSNLFYEMSLTLKI